MVSPTEHTDQGDEDPPGSFLSFPWQPPPVFCTALILIYNFKGVAIKGGSNCCSFDLRQTKVSAHHLSVHGRVCKLETCSKRVQNFSGIGDRRGQIKSVLWHFGPPGPNFLHIFFVPFPYFESSLYIFSPGQMGKLMNVPNVVEHALYFLERQFGVPCNVVQNKFLLQVLPLDDVNAHHRCLTIAGRQISRSLSFFFHITDWIFCTSNHYWIFSSNNSERGN